MQNLEQNQRTQRRTKPKGKTTTKPQDKSKLKTKGKNLSKKNPRGAAQKSKEDKCFFAPFWTLTQLLFQLVHVDGQTKGKIKV